MIEGTIPSEPRLFETGALIAGRYEVVRTVGSGAMGWVLHVIDRSLGSKSVALKLLYPHLVQDKTTFARFQNEVLLNRDLKHSGIVQIYDLGTTDSGLFFISMEYVHGSSLKDLIYNGSNKGLPFIDALRVLYEITEAIAHAHSKGVIHRDLKPDNVLVSNLGEVKLADFGIARSLWNENGLTKTGGAVGTPYYMAPEQIRGETADARADIYSLGIIAYELVAGARPFDDDCFYNLAQKHFLEQVPDLATSTSGIPLWYHDLVKRCAAKDKDQRFASAEEIADLLRGYVPEGTFAPQKRFRRSPVAGVINSIQRTRKDLALPGNLASWTAWMSLVVFCLLISLGFVRTNSTIRAQTLWPLLAAEHSWGVEMVTLKRIFNVRIDSNEHTQLLSIDRPKDLFDAIDGGQENEGDKFTVRLLMLAGMDPNTRNPEGKTALQFAMEQGKAKAVGELIKYRADPNLPDANGNPVIVKLAKGVRPGFVKQLINAGARLDSTDADGNTLLHIAAIRDQEEIVRTLLNLGADIRTANRKGQTPLLSALSIPEWNENIVRLLIEGGSPLEAKDSAGRGIYEIVTPKRLDMLKALIDGAR